MAMQSRHITPTAPLGQLPNEQFIEIRMTGAEKFAGRFSRALMQKLTARHVEAAANRISARIVEETPNRSGRARRAIIPQPGRARAITSNPDEPVVLVTYDRRQAPYVYRWLERGFREYARGSGRLVFMRVRPGGYQMFKTAFAAEAERAGRSAMQNWFKDFAARWRS